MSNASVTAGHVQLTPDIRMEFPDKYNLVITERHVTEPLPEHLRKPGYTYEPKESWREYAFYSNKTYESLALALETAALRAAAKRTVEADNPASLRQFAATVREYHTEFIVAVRSALTAGTISSPARDITAPSGG